MYVQITNVQNLQVYQVHIIHWVVESLTNHIMDIFRVLKKGNSFVGVVEVVTAGDAAQITAFVVGVRADESIVELMGGVKLNGEGVDFICVVVKCMYDTGGGKGRESGVGAIH